MFINLLCLLYISNVLHTTSVYILVGSTCILVSAYHYVYIYLIWVHECFSKKCNTVHRQTANSQFHQLHGKQDN